MYIELCLKVWGNIDMTFCYYDLGFHVAVVYSKCKLDQTLNDVVDVCGIADDIIIYGSDKDGYDYDHVLQGSLKYIAEKGIKFNLSAYLFTHIFFSLTYCCQRM